MRFGFALLALATITARPAAAFTVPQLTSSVQRATSATTLFAPSSGPSIASTTALKMSTSVDVDPQVAIDDALKAAGSGVALFGKSGCPFCKKTKKALYGIGVHPTVVELDEVEGGAGIQKKLEELTGKSTVPNVWLDGKFIGGSEEIIAGVEGDMFDAVEKKEIIIIEDEPKIPIEQGPDALKVGDSVPDAKVWAGFASDDFVSLADYGKDKNILVVGLPGAFTPTCSGQQVPAYVEYEDKLKEAGVDSVIIYCVNDPAVMMAWAKDQGIENWEITESDGFVSFVSDPKSDLTSACGMTMTHPGPLSVGLFDRCKRFAFYAEKGTVKVVNVSEYEGDPAGDDYPEITLPASMIDAIKKA